MPGPNKNQSVPDRYTWEGVRGYVLSEHASNRTMRQICHDINQSAGPGKHNITHRTIQLIIAGKEPRNAAIRDTLGLPVLAPAPVCPACGIVHVAMRCPASRKPGKPRLPRLDRRRLALELLGVLNG